MCEARFALLSIRKTKSDLTTATVPAGTSFPAVSRELVISLCAYAAAFFFDQSNSVRSIHMRFWAVSLTATSESSFWYTQG